MIRILPAVCGTLDHTPWSSLVNLTLHRNGTLSSIRRFVGRDIGDCPASQLRIEITWDRNRFAVLKGTIVFWSDGIRLVAETYRHYLIAVFLVPLIFGSYNPIIWLSLTGARSNAIFPCAGY